MKKFPIFAGAATAMITPFKKDFSVDIDCMKKLADIQLQAGIKTLVVCGTTGEASTLTKKERIQIISALKDYVNQDCKIIAGTGCNNTAKAKEYTQDAYLAGADGILAVTPYYNKATQQGIIKYYTEICSVTPLPVIAYNVPTRTAVNILPETAKKLGEIENLCGIKEASGNMGQITESAMLCGNDTAIYSGSDELNLPILSVGGKGFISVVGGVEPKKLGELYEAWEKGDIEKARRIHFALLPLIKHLFSTVNPIPLKKLLNEKGQTEYILRSPLYAE